MDKAQVISQVVIPARDKVPEVLEPGKEPLYLPSSLVTSEGSSILSVVFNPITPVWSNHFYTLFLKLLIQWVTVIGLIAYKVLRVSLNKSGLKSSSNKGDFMRRSALAVYGDRKTSAICHCHDLRTFAPLGCSHTEPPFLATTKVPSIKPSLRSSLPRPIMSSAIALKTFSKTPLLTHSWKRLWQVWYGGYLSGRSCQRAPVCKTQIMPLRTSRLSLQGLPLPSSLRGGSGIVGLSISHCSSVRFILHPTLQSHCLI
jgi:hypothetical protein